MTETDRYLVRVLKSVLHGATTEEKPEGVAYERLFRQAMRHKVAGMVLCGVEKTASPPTGQILEQWKRIRNRDIITGIRQLEERDRIVDTFSKNHMEVIPLKGCVMKGLYPDSSWRTMADMDMLVHPGETRKAREILTKQLGYSCELYEKSKHDVYHRLPCYNVEIHRSLMLPDEPFYPLFDDIWDHAKPKEDTPCHLYLTDEDFFLHLLAHAEHHLLSSGSGVRNLLDIVVYLDAHPNLAIGNVIRKLEEVPIDSPRVTKARDAGAFARDIIDEAGYWFSEGGKDHPELADYIFQSGIYGTRKNYVENRMGELQEQKKGFVRIRYIAQRLFLPLQSMKILYPILEKAPILLPFCWIIRPIKAIFTSKATVKTELASLFKRKQDT